MKTKTSKIQIRLKRLATATVALWLGGSALTLRADSPVGDWDFYLSGGLKGVAQITFELDQSISGVELHSPGNLPKRPKPSNNPRSPVLNGDNPRGGEDEGLPNQPTELHFGTTIVTGTWGYGDNGKVVGVMTLTSANTTNGMSFIGVAKGVVGPRPRITLVATRSDSGVKSVLRGVMRGAALPDISGDYSETGVMLDRTDWSSKGYSRILTLTPGAGQNIYSVEETGPGYLGGGFAILTRNNYLGIYTTHYAPGTTNIELNVVSGRFNTNTLKASLTGYGADKYIIKTKLNNFP